MAVSAAWPERPALVRRARLLAWAGIAWHAVEFAVALGAGLAASSIALVGFGIDSAVEAAAGAVVLWRFGAARSHSDAAERRAQQLIAASFFLLAAYVTAEAARTLVLGRDPDASWIGIGLAAVTAVTMPALAAAKRRLGGRLGSAAAVGEGAQNLLCAYLSIALLLGLGANAVLGWSWADPLAAFAIAGLAVREGRASWRGDTCCEVC
jgi:divalent metal cation (Fe/Co/Zn/Cd) transporter